MASATAVGFPGGTKRAAVDGTRSVIPSTAVATTGTPKESASRSVRGNPSQAEVDTTHEAMPIRAAMSSTVPRNLTRSPERRARSANSCRSGPSPATTKAGPSTQPAASMNTGQFFCSTSRPIPTTRGAEPSCRAARSSAWRWFPAGRSAAPLVMTSILAPGKPAASSERATDGAQAITRWAVQPKDPAGTCVITGGQPVERRHEDGPMAAEHHGGPGQNRGSDVVGVQDVWSHVPDATGQENRCRCRAKRAVTRGGWQSEVRCARLSDPGDPGPGRGRHDHVVTVTSCVGRELDDEALHSTRVQAWQHVQDSHSRRFPRMSDHSRMWSSAHWAKENRSTTRFRAAEPEFFSQTGLIKQTLHRRLQRSRISPVRRARRSLR